MNDWYSLEPCFPNRTYGDPNTKLNTIESLVVIVLNPQDWWVEGRFPM